jgi:hypothetical protein
VGIVDLAAYPRVLYQLSLELKRRWIEPRIELGTVNSQRGLFDRRGLIGFV